MQHQLRDPVHHTISISPDERTLVDHPLFQRLRRIKQTAFLNLVFSGATHDRFGHSLGAMHMAGIIFNSMANEFINSYGPRSMQPAQRDFFLRLVRVTALFHDLGHGPFSHSLEKVNKAGRPIHPPRKELIEEGMIPSHWIEELKGKKRQDWLNEACDHEDFSLAIIHKISLENEGRIAGLQAQDVAALLSPFVNPSHEFAKMNRLGPSGKWCIRRALKDIVSGEIDADRMDYLLRDSHYTGVPYGQYDREMLISNLLFRPSPKKKNQLIMAIRRKAMHAFEDFLISRFHMFNQLYSHKTVVGFDIVLENALSELPDFRINAKLEDYVRWSDDWLLRKIIENRSSRWGQHIRDRVPLKHLFTVRGPEQKEFTKFITPFELSKGTTAWFPSLKNKENSQNKDTPKLWWRQSVSYLTRGKRGQYPLFVDDKGTLIPIEDISLLLKSDYVRRFDMIHVYCLRGEENQTKKWLRQQKISTKILPAETENAYGSLALK